MNDNISIKSKQDHSVQHAAHRRVHVVRRTNLRQPTAAAVHAINEVSQKERLFFEYCIENEPLLHDTVTLLLDGDAYPCQYSGTSGVMDPQLENHAHIHWGRVARGVEESVSFVKIAPDVVEATIITTIDGAMKISAPYHLSRRKRHAVLFKPFQETCTRIVVFHRMKNSLDPAQAWKMTMISGCQGGTSNNQDMGIIALRLAVAGKSMEMQSAFRHSFLHNNNGNGTASLSLKAAQEFGVTMKLRSKEMEQNMVVVRTLFDEDMTGRVRLGLHGDCRDGTVFCQEYGGKVRVGATPGVQRIVVEAVSRSSLYEPGARMASAFWIFPVIVL